MALQALVGRNEEDLSVPRPLGQLLNLLPTAGIAERGQRHHGVAAVSIGNSLKEGGSGAGWVAALYVGGVFSTASKAHEGDYAEGGEAPARWEARRDCTTWCSKKPGTGIAGPRACRRVLLTQGRRSCFFMAPR